MKLHPVVARVTERIRGRSAPARTAYLQRLDAAAARDRGADRLGCANVAHAFAGMPSNDKLKVVAQRAPNIGIVNAYNDMLSAQRLVRREHVVVGVDDADVGRLLGNDPELVVVGDAREGMGHVGAAHAVGAARAARERVDTLEVGGAQRRAAFTDALGDVEQGLLHGGDGGAAV